MRDYSKWVWLAQKCGAGSSEFLPLIEKFGDAEEIYKADFDEYVSTGISERLAADLCDKNLEPCYKILLSCQRLKAGVLCYNDSEYPSSLRALKNPPIVLYYLGKLPDFNRKLCIAVVGTRNMSEYGMKAAYKIAYEVASAGAVIVSGMALGIDGIASCAAISAKGETVAVLGCGINYVYPREHEKLRDMIKRNGAVITEFPPSTDPKGRNFPIRNRIISGLCQGTLVVDADISSGAMITAKYAILQGRDVYAVPGNIDAENTSGTNSLIRDGAQAVLCGRDIVENYVFSYTGLDTLALWKAEQQSAFNVYAAEKMRICTRVKNPFADVDFQDDGTHIGLTPPDRSKTSSEQKADGKQTSSDMNSADKKSAEQASGEKMPADKKSAEQIGAKKSLADKKSAKKPVEEKLPADKKEESAPTSEETPARRDGGGDNSQSVLASLNEKQRKIFEEMPLDRAVTVDYLTKTGFSLGEVISALTVLEIRGLISSLPGALYVRK